MDEVRLCPISMMKPLITKMDNSLSTLKKCKQLRMSSNAIAKIEGLAGCDSLTILSLGRNNLKKIEGLNEVADTLETSTSINARASLRDSVVTPTSVGTSGFSISAMIVNS